MASKTIWTCDFCKHDKSTEDLESVTTKGGRLDICKTCRRFILTTVILWAEENGPVAGMTFMPFCGRCGGRGQYDVEKNVGHKQTKSPPKVTIECGRCRL